MCYLLRCVGRDWHIADNRGTATFCSLLGHSGQDLDTAELTRPHCSRQSSQLHSVPQQPVMHVYIPLRR